MSYYNNSYLGYGGLYSNNYSPNTMQQNMQFQQPVTNYSQNYRAVMPNNLDGFPSYFVDSYEQVKQASVASDGTPSIFISNVEDRFWLKKTNTENGRTIVKTFIFQEDTEEYNKGNSTILNNQNNENKEDVYIKKEEFNNLLAPLIQDMNTIKEVIFNSTNKVTVKEKEKSENKLKIPN